MDALDVFIDEPVEAFDEPRDQRVARAEVVEQSALGDAGLAGGGLEGGTALALGDDEALERVEHGIASCRRSTHAPDATSCGEVISDTIPAGR